ncbi:hypothetical protein NEFER03_0613 [Nematocida sp. LUAm3]|nr:hypothetical protein NEFER03_0613 [Nematocida sp. LUAm3]KAI5175580.1 hypothetical protein NEFER02_1486 [Nematocida sp. LUAm2]KAI5178390.1 hypothetical protein NEFER01_1537 [Nematocida sp. LUAm1]
MVGNENKKEEIISLLLGASLMEMKEDAADIEEFGEYLGEKISEEATYLFGLTGEETPKEFLRTFGDKIFPIYFLAPVRVEEKERCSFSLCFTGHPILLHCHIKDLLEVLSGIIRKLFQIILNREVRIRRFVKNNTLDVISL